MLQRNVTTALLVVLVIGGLAGSAAGQDDPAGPPPGFEFDEIPGYGEEDDPAEFDMTPQDLLARGPRIRCGAGAPIGMVVWETPVDEAAAKPTEEDPTGCRTTDCLQFIADSGACRVVLRLHRVSGNYTDLTPGTGIYSASALLMPTGDTVVVFSEIDGSYLFTDEGGMEVHQVRSVKIKGRVVRANGALSPLQVLVELPRPGIDPPGSPPAAAWHTQLYLGASGYMGYTVINRYLRDSLFEHLFLNETAECQGPCAGRQTSDGFWEQPLVIDPRTGMLRGFGSQREVAPYAIEFSENV